jgi:hypothetical protein
MSACIGVASGMLFIGLAIGFIGSLVLWWVLDLLGHSP